MMLNPTEALLAEVSKARTSGARITVEEFIPIYKKVEAACGRSTTLKEFQVRFLEGFLDNISEFSDASIALRPRGKRTNNAHGA